LITCERCIHFQRDRINPIAGIGTCLHPARDEAWYPSAPHFCRHHEEQDDTAEEAPASE
jgi:hypothetical protein